MVPGSTVYEWTNKTREEMWDALTENEDRKESLALEITEFVHMCTAWLEALGYDETGRAKLLQNIAAGMYQAPAPERGLSASAFCESVRCGRNSEKAALIVVVYKEQQGYVARASFILKNGYHPSDKIFFAAATLEEVRRAIPGEMIPLPRETKDASEVIEKYI